MILEIFDSVEKPEETLKLVLRYNDNRDVLLCVVDRHGTTISGGILMVIKKAGEIILTTGVNDDVGLKLDSKGSIRIMYAEE